MSGRDEDSMNVRETARRLGVHENTVRNWEAKGILPAVRLPGSGYRRFSRADVERMRAEMWSQFAPATEMPRQRRDHSQGRPVYDDRPAQ